MKAIFELACAEPAETGDPVAGADTAPEVAARPAAITRPTTPRRRSVRGHLAQLLSFVFCSSLESDGRPGPFRSVSDAYHRSASRPVATRKRGRVGPASAGDSPSSPVTTPTALDELVEIIEDVGDAARESLGRTGRKEPPASGEAEVGRVDIWRPDSLSLGRMGGRPGALVVELGMGAEERSRRPSCVATRLPGRPVPRTRRRNSLQIRVRRPRVALHFSVREPGPTARLLPTSPAWPCAGVWPAPLALGTPGSL